MPEIGESSRSREDEPRVMLVVAVAPVASPTVVLPFPEVDPVEEEPDLREFQDIPVDIEQRRVVEIIAREEDQADSESEGYAAEMAEPVRGGVMRTGEDDSEDEDQMADSDPEEGGETGEEDDQMEDQIAGSEDAEPEEDPQGTETAVYHDDMGTTADDIIEELTTRNGELEDRVHHLEEQNQVHQDLEQQYKDVAYQALGEKTELEEVVRQKEQRIAELQAQLIAISAEYDRERMDRVHLHDAWVRAATRVDEVEAEYRVCEARIDRASLAIDTAFGRLRSRVRRYGRERHHSRRRISRSVVDHIAQQEHESAILRADL